MISSVQVLAYFIVMFMDILAPNWAKVVLITKWNYVMLLCSFLFFISPEIWECWDLSWTKEKRNKFSYQLVFIRSLQYYSSIWHFIQIIFKFVRSLESVLSVPNYNFVRSDHPYNVKKGCGCSYYLENLSLKLISHSFLSMCFVK